MGSLEPHKRPGISSPGRPKIKQHHRAHRPAAVV